jgi:peroxiredoxin
MIARVTLAAALACCAAAAADSSALGQAVARFEQQAAKASAGIAAELEIHAAEALKAGHPDLSAELARRAVGTLNANKDAPLGAAARKTLQALAPAEAASLPAPANPASPPARSAPAPEAAAIQARMKELRGNLSDEERGKLAAGLARQIQAMPAGSTKLGLAGSLANLSTEGDLGMPALNAVASALAQAMRENARQASAGNYLELASLVRYEHVAAPPADPAFDAAQAYLAVREQMAQEAGFTLNALDGKTYSLAALRGSVVLLNFWATWCPPCRKEMPDMQKLYERFRSKGLVVLGVSDEERATVEKYLAEQKYTFPILLDPDRKVNAAFDVDGIPKTFIFDRQGQLAAQSIDMRTEAQFLKMLKQAGME